MADKHAAELGPRLMREFVRQRKRGLYTKGFADRIGAIRESRGLLFRRR